MSDDFTLEFITVKEHTRRKNLKDVRARLIGTGGKARKTIENLTGSEIVIHDNSTIYTALQFADSIEKLSDAHIDSIDTIIEWHRLCIELRHVHGIGRVHTIGDMHNATFVTRSAYRNGILFNCRACTKCNTTRTARLKNHHSHVSSDILDNKIKVRELYSLVESVLQFKGFVMTRTGKLVTVNRITDAKGMDIHIVGENESVSKIGNVIVIKTFKVKHIDTATAQKTLTDMKLGISIQSVPEYGTLFITGYAYRMDKIQKVLDMVDLPGRIKEFRYRMLTYLTPSELAPKIQILAKELDTISISAGACRNQGRQIMVAADPVVDMKLLR